MQQVVNPAGGRAVPARRPAAGRWVVALLVGLVVGAGAAIGIASVVSLFADDSRSRLMLSDILQSDLPAFAGASVPDSDACGGSFGCIEAVEGDGVSIYRYSTLDHARQSVIYNDDADFYRSDRLVLEFDGDFPPDERFQMLQLVEGTWTGSES